MEEITLDRKEETLLCRQRSYSQSYGLPSGHINYESRMVKKVECQRTDVFELWCWRRLLKVPWIAKRSNQSILREMNTEYSQKRQRLKLKLQYFGHLM